MRWLGDPDGTTEVDRGIAERRFEASVDGRLVPGILWLPAGHGVRATQAGHGVGATQAGHGVRATQAGHGVGATQAGARPGPRPLVLIGHGATLHKRVDHIVALARLLVRDHDFAAVALDAPGHGDRRRDTTSDDIQLFADFLAEWSRAGSTDDVIAEWQAVLREIRELDEVGDGPVGYWGLSMGTIYGIPLVAAEPKIQVAVFGLLGLLGPTRDRLEADSRALACPILFIQQWHDQMIPRRDAFALFDVLGSIDKRLHAHPGEHSAVPAEELLFSVEFLARHLAPKESAGSDPPRS